MAESFWIYVFKINFTFCHYLCGPTFFNQDAFTNSSTPYLPPGKPSQISSLSYRQKTPAGGVGSGSNSKLSNSRMISDILGAKIMKVQSRLLGYFSGKPGDLMTPLLEVKFLEHSGPAGEEKRALR